MMSIPLLCNISHTAFLSNEGRRHRSDAADDGEEEQGEADRGRDSDC